MQLAYGAFSIIGRNHRLNEDRFRLLGNTVPVVAEAGRGQIFAVFDGMGALPGGGEAAQYMCDRLLVFITSQSEPDAGDTLAILLSDDEHSVLTSDHSIGYGLLRFFGQGKKLEIEVREYGLAGGEVVILASDGVIKGINRHEIAACAGKTYPLSAGHAAAELCRMAENRGSQDDITAVVIEVEDLEDEK